MSTMGENVQRIPDAMVARGDARRQRGGRRVPRRGDAEGDRKDRAVTVDDVVRKENRNLQARLFDGTRCSALISAALPIIGRDIYVVRRNAS